MEHTRVESHWNNIHNDNLDALLGQKFDDMATNSTSTARY
jgi:hypothetical protein